MGLSILWESIGNKICLLESLHNHVVNNCGYLENYFQGILLPNTVLEWVLKLDPSLKLPNIYPSTEPLMRITSIIDIDGRSIPLSPIFSLDPRLQLFDPVIYLRFDKFKKSLKHITDFLTIISGNIDINEFYDLGQLSLSNLINFEKNKISYELDNHISWLQSMIRHSDTECIPMTDGPANIRWTILGKKIYQLESLYYLVLDVCSSHADHYDLQMIQLPNELTYSYQQTMGQITKFLRAINGENRGYRLFQNLKDTGLLIYIFDFSGSIYIDHSQRIVCFENYKAEDILTFYIDWLDTTLQQCIQVERGIRTAQDIILAQRYQLGGPMYQQCLHDFTSRSQNNSI
jgi:hypothetical protein